MRSTVAAGGAVAALLVFAPSALGATAVSVAKRCYAEGDRIAIDGTGFSPGGGVDLSLERAAGEVLEQSGDPVAGQDGTVGGTYGIDNETGWFTGTQTRFEMTLRLVDRTRRDAGQPVESPEVTATTSFIFSRWNVGVAAVGGKIRAGRPFRYRAVGYTNAVGKPLFAHWVRGRTRVFTKRLGVLSAPCGDRGGRLARGFPFRPRAGTYKVNFNTSRTNAFARDTISHTTARVRRAR
ncbi:MAG TPA: hypothetical protein VF587_12920 [Solirubrobacteraceae bacterium]